MNKNNIIGFVLMAAVLIGYGIWSQPSAEQKAAQKRQDSIENVARVKAENAAKLAAQQKTAQAKAAAEADTTALFHAALKGNATNVVLKNNDVELTLNTKGGVVTKAVIKNFDDRNGNNYVTLFDDKTQSLNFAMAAKTVNINTADLYFTPSNQTDSTVTMTAAAGNGKSLVINYVLGKDYMLHTQIQAVGLGNDFAPSTDRMDVQWKELARQQERGFTFENRYASLTYHKTDGGTDYLSEAKSVTDEAIEEKIDWVAFKNQFFSAVMIAKN
uniref:membrane protein insertase YidC n=1 Tax=uncultured Prevotella sp. TaxID=159272 RepID=UPI0027E3179C